MCIRDRYLAIARNHRDDVLHLAEKVYYDALNTIRSRDLYDGIVHHWDQEKDFSLGLALLLVAYASIAFVIVFVGTSVGMARSASRHGVRLALASLSRENWLPQAGGIATAMIFVACFLWLYAEANTNFNERVLGMYASLLAPSSADLSLIHI